MNINKKEVKL